jgi:anti-anti-sigma factor
VEIKITQADAKTSIILKGRFDFQTIQEFQRVLESELTTGKSVLAVDLSQVSFIDSSALGSLLVARESCEKAGGGITLIQPRDYVDKILKLCLFDQFFQIEQ